MQQLGSPDFAEVNTRQYYIVAIDRGRNMEVQTLQTDYSGGEGEF